MDSKDLKNLAEEGKRALDLDEVDQVTGGAGVGGLDVGVTPGRPTATSGVLNEVTKAVLNQGVSSTGHDVFSTKGIGLSEETDALNTNR